MWQTQHTKRQKKTLPHPPLKSNQKSENPTPSEDNPVVIKFDYLRRKNDQLNEELRSSTTVEKLSDLTSTKLTLPSFEEQN